eukprot:gene3644-6221_t
MQLGVVVAVLNVAAEVRDIIEVVGESYAFSIINVSFTAGEMTENITIGIIGCGLSEKNSVAKHLEESCSDLFLTFLSADRLTQILKPCDAYIYLIDLSQPSELVYDPAKATPTHARKAFDEMAQTGIADIFNKMIVVLYTRQGMEEVIEQNELQYLRHNDIVHTFVDFSLNLVYQSKSSITMLTSRMDALIRTAAGQTVGYSTSSARSGFY